MTSTVYPGWVDGPYWGNPPKDPLPRPKPGGRPMAPDIGKPIRGPVKVPVRMPPYYGPVIGVAIAIIMSNAAEDIYQELPKDLQDFVDQIAGLGLSNQDWGEAANDLWDVLQGLLPQQTDIAKHLEENPPISGETAETPAPMPDNRLAPIFDGLTSMGDALQRTEKPDRWVYLPQPAPVRITVKNPATGVTTRFSGSTTTFNFDPITVKPGISLPATDPNVWNPPPQSAPFDWIQPDIPNSGIGSGRLDSIPNLPYTGLQGHGIPGLGFISYAPHMDQYEWTQPQSGSFQKVWTTSQRVAQKFADVGLRSMVESTMLNQASDLFLSRNPDIDLAPEMALRFTATNTGGLSVSQSVSTSMAQATAAEHTLRKDQKWASQVLYMSLLKVVNQSYGRISEIIDTLKVLFANVKVNGKPIQWDEIEDWRQLFDSKNEVTIDQEGMFLGLLQEQMLDLAIGVMSDLEKRFMIATFGPGHWINNQMGLPSTWYRRLTKWHT